MKDEKIFVYLHLSSLSGEVNLVSLRGARSGCDEAISDYVRDCFVGTLRAPPRNDRLSSPEKQNDLGTI
jgi:hypothetical protein